MVTHCTLDIDPIGGGTVVIDGRDVTSIIEGADLIVRPGQPTVLRVYTLGAANVEVDGVVEVHREVEAADVAAEVGALLRGLDGDLLWSAMMADPTVDLADPATAFLRYVAAQIDPEP